MKNTDFFIDPSEVYTIKEAGAALDAILASIRHLDGGLVAMRNSFVGAAKSMQDMGNAELMLNAYEREANNLIARKVQLQAQLTPLLKEERQAIADLAAARNKENAEARIQANLNAQVEGSFGRAKAQLVALKAELNNMKMGTPEFDALIKQINTLNTEIVNVEASFGQFGRNVGNYGFNPLIHQAQLLTSELPNLAQSPRIFIQSLSNNIGMFANSIKMEMGRIRAEIAETGKSSTTIIRQIVRAFTSWQTVIMIFVTLFTAFGEKFFKWIGDLITAKNEVDKLNESIRNLQLEAAKSSQSELTNLELLYKATQDLTKSMDERQAAVDELQRKYPDYLKNISDEDIMAGKAADAYERLKENIMQTAIARAAADKIAEIELKRAEELSKLQANPKGAGFGSIFLGLAPAEGGAAAGMDVAATRTALAQERQANAISKVNEEADKERKIYEDIIDDVRLLFNIETQRNGLSRTRRESLNAERKAYEDLAVYEIDLRRDIIRNELESGRLDINERMALVDELYDLEIQRIQELARVQRENLINRTIEENTTYNDDGTISTTITSTEAEKKVANQLILLEQTTSKAILDEVIKRNDSIIKIEDDYIAERQRLVERQLQNTINTLDEQESAELVALSSQYSGILTNQEDYEDRRLAITRKYADERSKVELEALEEQLRRLREDSNLTIAEEQNILDLEQEIADYKVELNKDANDRIIEDDERAREKRIEMLNTIKSAAFEVFDFITSISKINTDRQIDDLDKQEDASEKRSEKEIDATERLADHGAITEEQKNARIAASEEKLEVERERIDAKRREIEMRQARLEVIINTARAIMSAALTQPFIPLGLIAVATATALGAAQLSAISAARYAEGTKEGGHRGGLAWVGDGGRAEMVIIGDNIYRTPSTPTLIDMPVGAQVLPDWDDAIKKFALTDTVLHGESTSFYDISTTAYNDNAVTSRLDRNSDQMERLIRSIKSNKINPIDILKQQQIKGIN